MAVPVCHVDTVVATAAVVVAAAVVVVVVVAAAVEVKFAEVTGLLGVSVVERGIQNLAELVLSHP